MSSREPIPPAVPYWLPPRVDKQDGTTRRVGLELELGGLSLERTVEVLGRYLGSSPRHAESALRASIESRFGSFTVELDSIVLQDKSYLKPLISLGVEEASPTSRAIEEAVVDVAREIVPLEIVTPPIPWTELRSFDPLWLELRRAGAEGTLTSVFHAFGLHFNAEVVDARIDTTVAVLQAYLLLEDWLVEELDVNLTRQIAPYIRGFPEPYRRLVLAPGYRPSWERFTADYLRHNPTRNRRLDLLPLICDVTDVDPSHRVREWALVKPRPAYHYRLPNSEIAQPGWTPAIACNGWVTVERLAQNEELRAEMASSYLQTTDWPLRMQKGGWIEHVRHRLPALMPESSLSGGA